MLILLDDSSEGSNSSWMSSSSSVLSSSADEYRVADKKPKIENYLDVINSYTDLQFKQHFRIERFCVNRLISNKNQ